MLLECRINKNWGQKVVRYFILFLAAASVAGCGTVVRGTKQGVRFESTPDGAAVTVVRAKKRKTEWNCVSPCELQLSRKRDFNVTFDLEGHKPVTARLASRLGAEGGATAIPGNFVAGGGIGFIVDAGTGANMQLKPDPMRAKLAPIDSAEDSIVFDVRIEGGGVEDAYVGDDNETAQTTKLATSDKADESQLKRLPRQFGAVGVRVEEGSDVAGQMSDAYGVQLTEIDPNGAAARANLKNGDVVQAINSQRVASMDDINAYLDGMNSGDTATVVIWRDRELYEAELLF